jgi:hypothetical protein
MHGPCRRRTRVAETYTHTDTDFILYIVGGFRIPLQMRCDSTWKTRMRAAAADAIAQLRDGASANEIQTAAQNAVIPLVREFESVRVRAEIVDGVCVELRGGDGREWEEGKEAVRAALADLPLGVSRRELERVRAKALAPIHAAIAAQQRAELLRKDDYRFYRWPEKLRRRAEAEISEAFDELPECASKMVYAPPEVPWDRRNGPGLSQQEFDSMTEAIEVD